MKEAELTFNLVVGEEEEKFLQKALADMKDRRSKFQKGGRGGNRGGRGGRGGFKNFGGRKRRNDEGNDNYGKRAKVGSD